MRIRATKPEFWQSKTISTLDWDTRLILKALESYVDDNGVGRDSVTLFATAAFPYDIEKSPEIFAKVSRSLSRLSEVGIIVRYTVGGEPLVYVRQWKKWQYIDKPKQGRYPRPDGSMNYRDAVDESIGAGQGITDPSMPDGRTQPPENLAKTARKVPEECPKIQSGEQGNRGSEEQGRKDSSDPDGPDDRDPLAHITEDDFPTTFTPLYPKAFEEWWEHYPRKEAKKAALEAWKRACKRASKEDLTEGAIRYANDPNRDPQFTKQPTRWLNGDCWLDDPIPARADGPRYPNGQPMQGADLRAAENANIANLFATPGQKAIDR